MNRRTFVAGLGGAAAWPVVARAQPAVPVIGLLSSSSLEKTSSLKSNPFLARFHEGLSEIGYIEGRNVAIEYRWAEEHYDRLPARGIGSTSSEGDRCSKRWLSVGVGRQSGDNYDSDRFHDSLRPGQAWAGLKLQPSRWEPHRRSLLQRGGGSKAPGTAAQVGAQSHVCRTARQPGQLHRCRVPIERNGGCYPCVWATAVGLERK